MEILSVKHLWLFPFFAGTVWFSTLLSLLIYWLANGRERYPHQSNKHIAFISDIGAFQMHPVFVIGGTITGVTFAGTVISVHYARYHRRLYAIKDVRWRMAVSILACVFGVAAGLSLILLTLFDTARFHNKHVFLLLLSFGTLGLSAILTTVVWFDQTWQPSEYIGLRRWYVLCAQYFGDLSTLLTRAIAIRCIASAIIVAIETCLSITFVVVERTGYMKEAGILEWIITFIGCGYLFCFVGFLWVPRDIVRDDGERRPLLQADPE